MNIVEINADNIEKQHICCAIGSNAQARASAASKKDWMAGRFAEGYRFFRLDAQGKAFIETTPAQNAWAPITADGWFFIDCFWVAGALKGQGVAARLLQTAMRDAEARGGVGLVALAGSKKQPFLSDGDFYRHKGFVLADEAPPFYQLLALPFGENVTMPRFNKCVENSVKSNGGVQIRYTRHCPHTARYTQLLQPVAEELGVPFEAAEYTSVQAAQNAPCPFTTYAFYYNGQFVTNEIFSPGKIRKFLEEKTRK